MSVQIRIFFAVRGPLPLAALLSCVSMVEIGRTVSDCYSQSVPSGQDDSGVCDSQCSFVSIDEVPSGSLHLQKVRLLL